MRIGSAVDNHNYFVIRASCDDLYLAILNAYDTGLPDCQWGPLRTAAQWYTDVKPPRVHIFDTRTGAFRSAWCVDLEMARRLKVTADRLCSWTASATAWWVFTSP